MNSIKSEEKYLDRSLCSSAVTPASSKKIAATSKISNSSLDRSWQHMLQFYEPKRILGEGSYGQVMKAKCRSSGKVVAIKLIKDVFSNVGLPRYILREISLLHQLSRMPGNIFTTKLLDIIIDAQNREDL